MSGSAPPIAVRNQLLTALPPEVLASIKPRLRHVSLAVRDSLIVPGKRSRRFISSKVAGSP